MSFPTLPEWAVDDVQSEISQQLNVVEPPSGKKLAGWGFKEKPVRQWMNWLARQTYLCLADLQTRVASIVTDLDLDEGSFTPVWTGLDLGSLTTNLGYYCKVGNMMTFTIHTVWSGNANTAALQVTNMPFAPKNIPNLFITCKVTRGIVATLPTLDNLAANNGPDNVLGIWHEDVTLGTGQTVSNAGATGELIISGSYALES